MAREGHSDEDCLKCLRGIKLQLAGGCGVATSCPSVGIGDATDQNWRRKFGGMGP
jgi:hypothetical protein